MARRVVWLAEAVADVQAIAAFIAADAPTYASVVVKRLLTAAASLSEFSNRGRMVPEWGDDSVREIYVHRYRLIFRLRDQSVEVLAVVHGARLLPDDLKFRN